MKRLVLGLGASLLLAMAGCIFVEREAHHYDRADDSGSVLVSASCPIEHALIRDTASAPSYTYHGKTLYFCCKDCRAKFEAGPEAYASR